VPTHCEAFLEEAGDDICDMIITLANHALVKRLKERTFGNFYW